MLNAIVGDSGSGGTKGLVPAPASGDATKFLKGNGTWASAGGGGAPSQQLNFNAGYYIMPGMNHWAYNSTDPGSMGVSVVNTLIYALPFTVSKATTTTAVGIMKVSSTTGGVKFGVYASDGTGGLPGTLLSSVTASTALGSGGTDEVSYSQALSANTLYYLAFIVNATSGSVNNLLPMFTVGHGWYNVSYTAITMTGTYSGGLQSTFSSTPGYVQFTASGGAAVARGNPGVYLVGG
jgi:hypothetical protein